VFVCVSELTRSHTHTHTPLNTKTPHPTTKTTINGQGQGKGSGKKKGGKAKRKGDGAKRQKVLKKSVEGISKASIRRLARRGGVKRVSGQLYEEARGVLKSFVEVRMRVCDLVNSLTHTNTKTGCGA